MTRGGMNSQRLSARTRQPGHDRSFVVSEETFVNAARACLDESRYAVADHPRDLAGIFPGEAGERALGVSPEASVTSLETGRKFFIEVKKQGPAGNADERACKHHTVQFYRTLHELYGYDFHPFVTIMCDSLASLPRYTRKTPYYFEPNHFLLWENYDVDLLADFLQARCREWLD